MIGDNECYKCSLPLMSSKNCEVPIASRTRKKKSHCRFLTDMDAPLASGNTTSRVCGRCRSGEMLGSRYASEIPALGHDLGWRRNLCSWKQRKNSGIPTLSFCSKNESNPLSKPFMIYNPGSSQIWGGWTHLSWSLSRCRRKGEKSWSNLPSNG